jgi:alginate O-acetyltransferase complex protein AlgI
LRLVHKDKFRNTALLLFSYIFYLYGAGSFLLILMVSTLVDYVLALMIKRRQSHRKLWITISVIVNLALLAYYKYANFFVSELNNALSYMGLSIEGFGDIILPIGISFFTFQKLSYIIDVYRGRKEPLKNVIDYALYVAMFPQLIAGPIIRFHEISEQLKSRTESWELFHNGVMRFCWGLTKKVLIANSCAEIADTVFSLNMELIDTKTAWLGTLAYTFQIYFDFSAYSDMAIGLGMLFGFRFPENFNRPYSSISITDFWRRWHMTLSRWFKDYLYIPLGGNRKGAYRTYINLIIIFILCGLWHGASWTFLLWGLYHGAFLIFERVTGSGRNAREGHVVLRRLVTLLIVMTGWVVFRSDNVSQCMAFLNAMFVPVNMPLPFELIFALNKKNIFLMLVASAVFFLPRDFTPSLVLIGRGGPIWASARLALVLAAVPYCMALIVSGSHNPFIYFRF